VIQLVGAVRRHRGTVSQRAALGGITLEVERGERVGVLGPSGAGKSTLLRVLAGVEPLDDGVGEVLGFSLGTRAGRRALCGRVQLLPQDPAALLGVGRRVGALMEESLRIHEPGAVPSGRVMAALAAVGLGGRERADPHRLSGGEQRRLALARVLIARPGILLADEPTTGLDGPTAWKVGALLRAGPSSPATVIVVSHSLNLLTAVTQRIIVLDQGHIVADLPAARVGQQHHHTHLQQLLRLRGRTP